MRPAFRYPRPGGRRAGHRPLLPFPLLALLLWAACGGGGGFVEVEPGKVGCENLRRLDSYRYRTEVRIDLEARDPALPATDPYGPDPLLITQIIDGEVQDEDRVRATIDTVEDQQEGIDFIAVGSDAWTRLGSDWLPAPPSGSGPIPYLPLQACYAIAADIDVAQLSGEPETVGGIPSQRFRLPALRSDFPDRHPDFGPQSDAARIIEEFDVDIWLADEGSYTTKLQLSGTGAYVNGRTLSISLALELSDVNKGIRVDPPY